MAAAFTGVAPAPTSPPGPVAASPAPAASLSHSASFGGASSTSTSHSTTASRLVNRPTFITYGACRFLIMDSPTDQNLPAYVEVLTKRRVTTLVRACEPSYSIAPLTAAKIAVQDMPFTDGDPPPADVIARFLAVCDETFGPGWTTQSGSAPAGAAGAAADDTVPAPGDGQSAVAVHCVAGLGRAPVLVAVALMETGMSHNDCIDYIRKKRRGAINARQIKFVESYQRRQPPAGCCVIM